MKYGVYSSELQGISAPADAQKFKKSLADFMDYYTDDIAHARKVLLYGRNMVRLSSEAEDRFDPARGGPPPTPQEAINWMKQAKTLVDKTNRDVGSMDKPAEPNDLYDELVVNLHDFSSLLGEFIQAIEQGDTAKLAVLDERNRAWIKRMEQLSRRLSRDLDGLMEIMGAKEKKILNTVEKESRRLEETYGLFWLPGELKVRSIKPSLPAS